MIAAAAVVVGLGLSPQILCNELLIGDQSQRLTGMRICRVLLQIPVFVAG